MRFDNHEKNIDSMINIEKLKGFMFWNLSPEGEEFFKDNKVVIGAYLSMIVLNQK